MVHVIAIIFVGWYPKSYYFVWLTIITISDAQYNIIILFVNIAPP